jgi:purine-binding chemotaxis protein CheW
MSEIAGKFLSFRIGSEEYAIRILAVQEIIGLQPITAVPTAPAFVRGVINLRGKIVPVVDLRVKFGMSSEGCKDALCIVVVHAGGVEMGIPVDSVAEVVTISEGDVSPPPEIGGQVSTDYILGIGKSQGKVRFLLDIDKTLSPQAA